MIDFIRGRVVRKTPTHVVVEVGGIGYSVQAPFSTVSAVEEGKETRLLTYLHVREDGLRLFGFATEAERELFLRLMDVSKVGPAIALATVSALPPQTFYELVRHGDAKQMAARVKGMGAKTAERVILELRAEAEAFVPAGRPPSAQEHGAASDAIKGLVQLGSTPAEAERAVSAALKELGDKADAAALFRRALAIR